MVDVILWLGDRLELGIPVVLALVLAVVLLARAWRARRARRQEASERRIEQRDDGQLVVLDGNRVRGDVHVSQRRNSA